MENCWELVREIQNGHRMGKPEFLPNFLEEIMTNCWQNDPKERSTFSQITDLIEKYIESLVKFDYLNI
jgi:hypothetical protein